MREISKDYLDKDLDSYNLKGGPEAVKRVMERRNIYLYLLTVELIYKIFFIRIMENSYRNLNFKYYKIAKFKKSNDQNNILEQ